MQSLTRDQLREWADENLKTLRGSFKPPVLPADWERDLASLPRDTLTQELLHYVRVKHFYFLRYGQLEKQNAPEVLTSEKARTVRQLLTREPIRITLAGRTVEVTSRGRLAMLELAAHDLARREIDQDLERLAELAAYTERQRDSGRLTHNHARRRLRHFRRMHSRYFRESLHRTRAILANALTPDGRAASADDAPEWWDEVSEDDEGNLLIALFRAGPERLEQLGPPPPSNEPKKRAWVEDLGFWSLYSYYEKEAGLSPGAFVDEDVAQFSTWLRAGSPYYPPPGSREVH